MLRLQSDATFVIGCYYGASAPPLGPNSSSHPTPAPPTPHSYRHMPGVTYSDPLNHFWSPLGGVRVVGWGVPPSKLGVLDGAVMKKSKKHCTGASPGSIWLLFTPKTRKNDSIPGSPGFPWIPPDPGDLVHGLQLGTSPTRAGGQDDVSSQANSLKPSSWPPCVRKGGSEQRARTSLPGDPWDPRDPRDPRMSSRSCIFLQFLPHK